MDGAGRTTLVTHMRPPTVVGHHRTPLRLSRRRRHFIYGVGWLLWGTGALWLVFHYFFMGRGEFGDAPHPSEPWWLRLHAVAAFLALWSFGLVWGVHIVAGWQTRRQRVSGGILFGTLSWLTLTGYLLYYLTDDRWRSVSALAHWVVGLAIPLVLAVHVILGRRRAKA